jgi:hypothetical protein
MVGVAADANRVIIVGNHRGAIDFGDGLLPAPPHHRRLHRGLRALVDVVYRGDGHGR